MPQSQSHPDERTLRQSDGFVGSLVHREHKSVPTGKRSQPTDVIRVFVGNEHSLDIPQILIDLLQRVADVSHAAADIHQYARPAAAEEMAVAGTAAC